MTNQEKLGTLGEDLFVHLFGGEKSKDKFDTTKDILSKEGWTIEVKTQNRHQTAATFTIGSMSHLNNLLKCMVVDRLIFVEYDHTDTIKIWEVQDRKDYIIYKIHPSQRFPQGLTMVGYSISKMSLLDSHVDGHLAQQMRDLSQSAVFRKK